MITRLRLRGGLGRCWLMLAVLLWPVIAGADSYPVVVEAEVSAVLSAEREGVLERLAVVEGDAVKEGDVIAVVFHRDLIQRKEQREARQRYLDIQVENLNRLHEQALTTDEELARAKMEQEINEMEIRIAEAEILRSRIVAPFSGIIVERKVKAHEWVRPGQPVVELYDPRQLRIVGDIPAEIIMRLKPGRVDNLQFPDIKTEVRAKVGTILPLVNIKSSTIKVFWQVDASGRKTGLLPGMKGFIKLGSE